MPYGHVDASPVLDDALRRSATIRRLVADLEASDVVVWIQLRDCGPVRTACLRWMGASGGIRRLHISINPIWPEDERIVLLGHELQHAVEISRAPGVTDATTLFRLYESSGTNPLRRERQCETDAAIDVSRRVSRELRGHT